MASFVLSFFPLDVLDEILDLIESVSEEFLTYSFEEMTLNKSDPTCSKLQNSDILKHLDKKLSHLD